MGKKYGFIIVLLTAFVTFFSWVLKSVGLGVGVGVGMGLPMSVALLQKIRKEKTDKGKK